MVTFTYVLMLAALLDMPHFRPIPIGAYQTLEACQADADKAAIANKDELADPKNETRGLRFVCAELKGKDA